MSCDIGLLLEGLGELQSSSMDISSVEMSKSLGAFVVFASGDGAF